MARQWMAPDGGFFNEADQYQRIYPNCGLLQGKETGEFEFIGSQTFTEHPEAEYECSAPSAKRPVVIVSAM